MRPLKTSLSLWIGFGVCCLAYAVWVIYLGLNNFDMVHGGYRQAAQRLQPERVREIALHELIDRCRREAKLSDRPGPDAGESLTASEPCLSWPADVLEERRKTVEKRLIDEKNRSARKLVLFYLLFGVVFLFLPPALMFLLLFFLIWLWRNLRIVK